jgi:hypothetical protein
MATQEVVLRPGDSISVRIDVPGQPLRLEMSLSPNGVAVSGDVPMGAPTIFGGVPPAAGEPEPVDLTDDFALEDVSPPEPEPAPQVESLAAVEPFGDQPEAVDIPFEDISEDTAGPSEYEETVTDDSSLADDLDLDLGDLDDTGGEEMVEDLSVDIPEDDPTEGLSLGLDDEGAVEIPADDIDIPEDDAGFSADAMTMVPPTRPASAPSLSLDDGDDVLSNMSLEDDNLDASGNPKEKFAPNQDDTLPVWTGKARTYKDPEIEKKKETAKLDKGGKPAAKPPLAGKPLPGKAKLPTGAKQPITKQIKKPGTGAVGPAAGGGNFTVFLSPPKGADKKQAAAEIIAEIQGIDMNSAMALAGKMIVPVVKGVSEDEAQGVRDRFKDAGLSCRITQKR